MSSRNKLIAIAVTFICLFWLFLNGDSSSTSPPSSPFENANVNGDQPKRSRNNEQLSQKSGNLPPRKRHSIPSGDSTSTLSQVDQQPSDKYYPNGKPDRVLSLRTAAERREAGLCPTPPLSSASTKEDSIDGGSADSATLRRLRSRIIPWIVNHVIIGGVSDEELVNEEKFWGYNAQTQQSSSDHRKRCLLPVGHLRRILGRTRLSAIIEFVDSGSTSEDEFLRLLRSVSKLLSIYAPAWRVAKKNLDTREHDRIFLERRAKVFVFGITGGGLATAQRARYAEYTWGSRTPIQWFSDQWDPHIRPIVDLHPLYQKDRFKYLTFKISRIWQVVFRKYSSASSSSSQDDANQIDWYIRLWDDNYFYEENLYSILYRLPFNPQADPVLAGKMGWRHLGPADAVFPFAGGGAGWYLSQKGLTKFGSTIKEMEAWIPKLRARKDIFLPHDMHDEDVFLTAWIGKELKINCTNIPGVEHVSPGMAGKQRCMSDEALKQLRWNKSATIFFDYTGAKSRELRVEDTWYSYTKPLIWHYMSPKRLLRLEGLLYPARTRQQKNSAAAAAVAAAVDVDDTNTGELLPSIDKAPGTYVDVVKKSKRCYPGIPDGGPPPRGLSIFERPLPEEMRDPVLET